MSEENSTVHLSSEPLDMSEITMVPKIWLRMRHDGEISKETYNIGIRILKFFEGREFTASGIARFKPGFQDKAICELLSCGAATVVSTRSGDEVSYRIVEDFIHRPS